MNREEYFAQRRQEVQPQWEAHNFALQSVELRQYKPWEELQEHLSNLSDDIDHRYRQSMQEIIEALKANTQEHRFKVIRQNIFLAGRLDGIEFCETRDIERIVEAVEALHELFVSDEPRAKLTTSPRINGEGQLIEYEAYLSYLENEP